MRIMAVGDVHGKANDLDDCRALGSFIVQQAKEIRPARIVFMGDQYDTHALVHVEVQAFWIGLLKELNEIAPVVCLIGNHDMVGNGVETAANAMQVHASSVLVVGAQPHYDTDGVCYAGYGADLTQIKESEYLFCHHTFQGAKYENGFYAKDGIDKEKVPAKWIVSGHIHTPSVVGQSEFAQKLGRNVAVYLGSPRWLTVSDADVADRWIYVIDTEANTWTNIPTSGVVRVIRRLTDTEQAPAVIQQRKPNDVVVVDVIGTAGYVENRTKELKALGCRVRAFATNEVKRVVKESEGVEVSWSKFMDLYSPRYGSDKAVLVKMAGELNG